MHNLFLVGFVINAEQNMTLIQKGFLVILRLKSIVQTTILILRIKFIFA